MTKGPRGFVTIATGDIHYYKMAWNLLQSYKLNTDARYPFAIICDQENEYSSAFDYVIHIQNPNYSYMDKLCMYDYLPFEETIFIDADCLVYGDIQTWWDVFAKGSDFSYFGRAIDDLNTKEGWFLTDGMKEYKSQIKFVPNGSSGICYLRNTEVCKQVFDIAKKAARHYYDYPFAIFKEPADEPLIALGMAICNCRPVELYEVAIFSRKVDIKCDILQGWVSIRENGVTRSSKLIHWGYYSTKRSLYRYEEDRLYQKICEARGVQRNSRSVKPRLFYLVYDVKMAYNALIRRLKKLRVNNDIKY